MVEGSTPPGRTIFWKLPRTEERSSLAQTHQEDGIADGVRLMSAKTEASSEDMSGINQHFLAFLDADSYAEKYEIVSDMEEELDDHLINQMAASIDVIIEDGKLPERIRELESCIRTKAKYELGRTR